MTKSELIELIAEKKPGLMLKDVELSVKIIVELLSTQLIAEDRIEIRGFGSFSVRRRSPRLGRNPKTGDSVQVGERVSPHFKPGKALRDRVNNAMLSATE